MAEARQIRIGAWTATPSLNLLERETRAVKVEPRAMDVLMFLARHAGEVVSIEQLIAAVWKGAVVGDGSVYLAIRQLRQSLDDASDGSSYIETIPKRGYRLTARVKQLQQDEDTTDAASLNAPSPTGRSFSRWSVVAAATAAALLVVAFTSRQMTTPASAASVAVLPFANLSSDPEQEYFADGMTIELLNKLSRVSDLRVTGPTSSFHFRGRNENPRKTAAALGVEHLLEGSVRKAGERVRVTASLSNAQSGQQLWAQTYERDLEDVFAIQDQIAQSVADALQVKLGIGLGRMPGMTRNVAAYDEYLRGMSLNLERRPESFALAIAHLQRAVVFDPEFSLAWSGLATVYTNGGFVVPERADEWQQEASEALDRARALTPDAPHVLLEIGIAQVRSGHWNDGAATYQKLEESYARYGMQSRMWGPRGVFLLAVGRISEAVDALERACLDEPLAPAFALFLSEALLASGNPAASLAEVDRGLELGGLESLLLQAGVMAALSKGERDEIEERVHRLPADSSGAMNRGMLSFLDTPASAAVAIREAAVAATASEKAVLAQWAAYYRESALALELLQDATPHLSRPSLLWMPLMSDVRKLPEFRGLVQRLGLVDYWRNHDWPQFCRPMGARKFVCE